MLGSHMVAQCPEPWSTRSLTQFEQICKIPPSVVDKRFDSL